MVPCVVRLRTRSSTRSPGPTDPTVPLTERAPARPTLSADEIIHLAAEAAVTKKAQEPLGLDLRDLDGVCDFFFICTGTSEIQVKAISEHIEETLRKKGVKPWHIEGREGRRWVLLDYVDVVVHVFHEKTREYYMLDRLWGDARSVDLGLDATD